MRINFNDTEDEYYLVLEGVPFFEIKKQAAYKIKIKRYVEGEVSTGVLLLKKQASAEDSEKMLARIQDAAGQMGIPFSVSEEVKDDVENKREYAEEKSRAGIEIKHHDAKFQDYVDEYASVVNAQMVRPLRERQMWDSFFMCMMGSAGNFSVPGSGKTASVLGAYAYLDARGLASRIIVICPRNAFESWRNEFAACFGQKKELREFNVQNPSFKSLPRDERRRILRVDTGGCNLLLVNYEALPAIVDEVKELASESALLVFDEVHRVKKIKGKYAEAALAVSSVADRTIALTGTPIPNSYLDIYNVLNLMYPREYSSFFGFSHALLRNPNEYEIQKINSKIQPFFCRTTKDDLGVPPVNPDETLRVYVDADTEHLLDVLKMRYRNNKLTLMLRVMQLESDPRMLLKDLDPQEYSWLLSEDEETGEIDYVDYSEDIEEMILRAPKSQKVDECVELATGLVSEGKHVIVWCVFVHSMKLLAEDLRTRGVTARIVFGDTSQEDRERSLDEFRAGIIDVLITNPHTLSESVSLHSVCHDAIYFEYSFNLVHLLQSKDRIHRLGLPEGQYTQYYFMRDIYGNFNDEYSLDANIYDRLCEKERTMLDAIADERLEIMPSTDEDLDKIFDGLFDGVDA